MENNNKKSKIKEKRNKEQNQDNFEINNALTDMNLNNDKNNKFRLYESSVQSVKKEVEFFRKIFRMLYNKVPETFREDFCMTGRLSSEWVKLSVMNKAVGLDIDQSAIDYGIANNNDNTDRIQLYNLNVLDEYKSDFIINFDIVCSLNYSHFLLTKRLELVKYLKNVRKVILKGIYVIDVFGGSHIYTEHKYQHSDNDIYEFHGTAMNILNNRSLSRLTYKIKKNKYKELFRCDFRIYSLIELREALEEAGFNKFKLFIKEIHDNEDDDYAEYEEIDFDSEFFPTTERYTCYLISYI